jgi:hypothetical protein
LPHKAVKDTDRQRQRREHRRLYVAAIAQASMPTTQEIAALEAELLAQRSKVRIYVKDGRPVRGMR